MGNLFEQVKSQKRCYCGHLKRNHFFGGGSFCEHKKCNCEKFEALPLDHFDRCPCAECNSIYFYQDETNEFLFHCHACERSFKFDGCECFDEVD